MSCVPRTRPISVEPSSRRFFATALFNTKGRFTTKNKTTAVCGVAANQPKNETERNIRSRKHPKVSSPPISVCGGSKGVIREHHQGSSGFLLSVELYKTRNYLLKQLLSPPRTRHTSRSLSFADRSDDVRRTHAREPRTERRREHTSASMSAGLPPLEDDLFPLEDSEGVSEATALIYPTVSPLAFYWHLYFFLPAPPACCFSCSSQIIFFLRGIRGQGMAQCAG